MMSRLKDGCNPNAIISTEQWAIEVEALAANLKTELEEATREWESLDQLADALERLADSEGQQRKVRIQFREMEDELLKLTRPMDALRVDLPKHAVEEYKNHPDLRWGSTV
ncbi:hypothetical protein BHE74_00029255 [Ensete ventricosum]|nr:hypothetical protein BHE74_00029255 [Ensete ventricosum]